MFNHALGIALRGEVADQYPLARLVSFAFSSGVENPDLATDMPRSPINTDDFAQLTTLVEAHVASLTRLVLHREHQAFP